MPETPTDAAPTLGDCILHVTHHEMTGECWNAVIEHYLAVVGEWLRQDDDLDMDALNAEAVNRYKADYERALLNAIRSEVADV